MVTLFFIIYFFCCSDVTRQFAGEKIFYVYIIIIIIMYIGISREGTVIFMNIEREPQRSLNRTLCVYTTQTPIQFLIRDTYRLQTTRTFHLSVLSVA